MPITGVIADRVKGLIPVTWDALNSDARVGDGPLQTAIDLGKEMVTGEVIDPSQEAVYPLLVIDYIAKLAVIEIAPAGIDFWMNNSMSVNSTGTNEVISYIDRAQQLQSLRDDLIQETRLKQPEISKLVGYWIDNGRAVPQMSSASINPYHLTPSPEEFPRPWRITEYS